MLSSPFLPFLSPPSVRRSAATRLAHIFSFLAFYFLRPSFFPDASCSLLEAETDSLLLFLSLLPQIIEELYTRLSPEEITETLSLVKTSLSTSPQQTSSSKNSNSRAAPNGYGTMEGDEHDELDQDDWGGEQEYDEDAQGPEDMGFEQDEERDQD